jgi:hypothetical protein
MIDVVTFSYQPFAPNGARFQVTQQKYCPRKGSNLIENTRKTNIFEQKYKLQ